MYSVLFWIKFLEIILNTFEQGPVWFCNLATKKFAFGDYFVCKIIKLVE